VTTTLRIPPELYEALREAAFRLRRSQNEIIAEAVEDKLRELGFLKPEPGKNGGMA
jgi:predicted DNA-binding protein